VRGPTRTPSHHLTGVRDYRPVIAEEEEEDRFIGRPCYAFNRALRANLDDTRCGHCLHYLTSRCPHIDEFLDDVEDLAPD
jgi:hypothetical protein